MKNLFKFVRSLFRERFIAALFVMYAMMVIGLLVPSVNGQDVPYTTGTLTLSTNLVDASTDATVTSDAVRLRGNQGIAFLPSFKLAAPGCASNVTFRFQVSTDGTSWTTTEPFTYTMAANITNTARGYINLDRALSTSFNNVRYVRLSSVNNTATNGLTSLSVATSYFNK